VSVPDGVAPFHAARLSPAQCAALYLDRVVLRPLAAGMRASCADLAVHLDLQRAAKAYALHHVDVAQDILSGAFTYDSATIDDGDAVRPFEEAVRIAINQQHGAGFPQLRHDLPQAFAAGAVKPLSCFVEDNEPVFHTKSGSQDDQPLLALRQFPDTAFA
jgi:hypothetical protein